jgi:hypothetical protein
MNPNLPKYLSGLLISLINLIPVYGVLYWNWQTFDLVFLYWLENFVIGFFMLMSMLIRRYQGAGDIIVSTFSIPFTSFHYTAFCIGHGIFITAIFDKLPLGIDPLEALHIFVITEAQDKAVQLAIAGIFIMRLIQWIRDKFIRPAEDDDFGVVGTAYIRILITHLSIFVCAFSLNFLGSPEIGLLFLVLIKILLDLYFDQDKKDQAAKNKKQPAGT